MAIYLPIARREYPWPRRAGIHLFNWVMWLLPAGADTFADDVGPDYQGFVALLFFMTIFMVFLAPFIEVPMLGVLWWQSILISVCIYLAIGIAYHLHERHWDM